MGFWSPRDYLGTGLSGKGLHFSGGHVKYRCVSATSSTLCVPSPLQEKKIPLRWYVKKACCLHPGFFIVCVT